MTTYNDKLIFISTQIINKFIKDLDSPEGTYKPISSQHDVLNKTLARIIEIPEILHFKQVFPAQSDIADIILYCLVKKSPKCFMDSNITWKYFAILIDCNFNGCFEKQGNNFTVLNKIFWFLDIFNNINLA